MNTQSQPIGECSCTRCSALRYSKRIEPGPEAKSLLGCSCDLCRSINNRDERIAQAEFAEEQREIEELETAALQKAATLAPGDLFRVDNAALYGTSHPEMYGLPHPETYGFGREIHPMERETDEAISLCLAMMEELEARDKPFTVPNVESIKRGDYPLPGPYSDLPTWAKGKPTVGFEGPSLDVDTGRHEGETFFEWEKRLATPLDDGEGDPMQDVNDAVNHPSHYTSHPSGVEQLAISEHFMFNAGAAIKYIWRHRLKGKPIQDLRKAVFHLEREIGRLQSIGMTDKEFK